MITDIEASDHLETTPEITLELIKKKAVRGVVALTSRMFVLQIIALVSTALLTFFLTPEQFGMFFIVSSFVNFYNYFSDIGLSASLIQKDGKLSEEDLRTTFTIQNGIVLILIVSIFLLTPLAQKLLHLDLPSTHLLWALAVALLLSSLKTIPSILMERKLDFNKLVIPQIVESLLYNLVIVYFAWKGFGVASFTAGVLVRGFTGLIVTYLLQPWMPGFAFSRDSLRQLLKFGLPFQLNTFLAVAKDDGMTIFMGSLLGPASVGLLGWAQKWATAPLRFFMDSVIRVTFPAYARMQKDREALSKAVTYSIFFITSFSFPSLIGLTLVAPLLTEIIPRYEKWQPALLALSLISINSAWAAVTTPMTNVLNAIGKIKTTFKLMIMWTILTWALLPALAISSGVTGVALGFAIIGTSSLVAIYVANKYVNVNFMLSVLKPLAASLIMAGIIFAVRNLVTVNIYGVGILVALGASVYAVSLISLVGVFNIKRMWGSIRS